MQKNYWLLVSTLCLALGACSSPSSEPEWVREPVRLVNPLMGTQSSYELSAGNTYPAIARPWGMHTWTPQTRRNGDGWTYCYTDTKLVGFKLTHQPSPWINDYGCFSLFPVSGPMADFSEAGRASWFSHKAETATPYAYEVYLAPYDLNVRLAPTERACILQFRYPTTAEASLIVDVMDQKNATALGDLHVDVPGRCITGYTTHNHGGVPDGFRNYFVIHVDAPIQSWTLDGNGRCKVVLDLPHHDPYHAVEARVGASFISPEQAERNLQSELDGKTYENIAQDGFDRWNEVLSRAQIAGGTDNQQETFYSCLYRSLLFPRAFFEYNAAGERVHYSPYNGQICSGYLYTDTGFWDTFRALFPLLNLLYPEENRQMQEGLVNTWLESHFLPEWASPGHRGCMVGNNSASVVADGFLKRIHWLEDSLGRRFSYPADSALVGYDIAALFQAMTYGAHHVHPQVSSTGRLGHDYYDSLGYVPCDVGINESVARTLEYAYDDWCIAQVAQVLHAPDSLYTAYMNHARHYTNVFDAQSNLMRGRNADGSFQTPFSPYKWGGSFTEGNAWHYTWSVFHDVPGLIELMGGRDTFTRMLDSVFVVPPIYDESYYGGVIHEIREMQIMNRGNYAHGNQPIQHMVYLYNWSDKPTEVGKRVRDIMDHFYTPTPDGYCGDEDNGQTSAWYVFSALGFYPVCPGSDAYAPGAPLFPHIRLHLANGRHVDITPSPDTYPQLRINGKVPTEVSHRFLISGK